MLKVLIADDSAITRTTLSEYIPWSELGMEIIGLAENGEEALSMCLELNPDILFTDIIMPFLTGLEVAISLQEKNMRTKIILISGAQDFNYAKTAVSINAIDYIVKPIKLDEVIEILKNTKNIIEMETNKEKVFKNLKKELYENMNAMKDRFLNNLIFGINNDKEHIDEKIKFFKLPFSINSLCTIAIAKIDNYTQCINKKNIEYTAFLNFSVNNIIQQALDNYKAGVCVNIKDNEFVIILNHVFSHNDKLTSFFEDLEQLLYKFQKLTISIGIGNQIKIDSVPISYNTAITALSHKFFLGNNSIIYIEDVTSSQMFTQINNPKDFVNLNHLQHKILYSLKAGNIIDVSVKTDTYFSHLTNEKLFTIGYLQGLCINLIVKAYSCVYEMDNSTHTIFSEYPNSIHRILAAETVTQMQSIAREILLKITKYFEEKSNFKHNNLINDIKYFVDNHYMENISLVDIANEVYMSTNYICALFKKETSMTIHDYLMKAKMKKARSMLENTDMKIFEIAFALGYENPNYFSYSFKRHELKTPQQYRESLETINEIL